MSLKHSHLPLRVFFRIAKRSIIQFNQPEKDSSFDYRRSNSYVNQTQKLTMKKKFSLGLVIALTMSGVFGGVSFAADASAPAVQATATAPVPVKVGAWTKFRPLTAADKALFAKVKMPLGVQYEPLAVRTQVVAGMNYDFFCNAKAVTPTADWYQAMVLIFKPLRGDPSFVKATRIDVP
jgi:hypothetical protein